MRKIVGLVAAIAAIALLLGGCTAPSGRPGQASPAPAPSETASPAPTTPAFAGEAPLNNWKDLIRVYPEVKADLVKAGMTEDEVATQAALLVGKKTPKATIKVAFGNAPGGDLASTGECKSSSGTCPTVALIEGLLPVVTPEGEKPYRDYGEKGKGLLIAFDGDGNHVVLYGLTLEKR